MTVRGAEGGTGRSNEEATTEGGERRAGAGQRVHFEALVSVGETGGAGFEAESMDVSLEGMRLRTAYLPELGDKLVCRFDGAGADLTVEGAVVLREQLARGGEFGGRFGSLDDQAAEALRAMCAPPEAIRAPAPSAERGTRVRLHIEGLGSPMKARVRETQTGEILVGSNLEFLRVGRALELEDVDHGSKREATIDHVKVEIDPNTNVPQLVVALAYADGKPRSAGATRVATLAFGAGAAPSADKPGLYPAQRVELTPPPVEAAEDDEFAAAGSVAERAPDTEASADEHADAGDEEEEEESRALGAGLRGAGSKAALAGRKVAEKIGPALSGMGSKAKGVMALAIAAVARRRVERAEAKKAAAPRRMTAPPPAGALKSEGRRLVRDDDGEESIAPPAPKSPKRAAAIGSAVGLLAVLAVVGVTRARSASHDAAPVQVADASTAAAAVAPPPALPAAPAGSGPVTANVPLFGATPLSTTEAVPAIPTPAATGGDPAAAAAPAPGAAPDGDEEPGLADDEGGPALKQWGNGNVKNPVVLKIKTDGAIEKINGAAGAMGFTVSMPDRRALSNASELARKDKRIASINVVNNAHGAEITVQFKDGVPAYLAKAKGDRLEIALGSEGKKAGHKKVAHKDSAEKPSKKKGDHGKKSPAPKDKAGAKKKGKR